MENMWLMAHSLGIGFHVISAIPADLVEKQVKSILNIPEHLEIALSVRLGYPTALTKYLRVRRDVDDFTHHNQFGRKGLGWENYISISLMPWGVGDNLVAEFIDLSCSKTRKIAR